MLVLTMDLAVTGMSAYRRVVCGLGLAGLLALAGCGGFSGGTSQPMPAAAPLPAHPQAAGQPGMPNAAPVAGTLSQYRLDSGDQLRVTVFGQENLSGTFRVDDAGAIAMPLLPPLGVRGLTTAQTKATIEQALSQTLLRNPNVSVEVSTFRPFFILGQVNAPGQYPFVSGMTVETAVAIAGGYTFRANTSRVRITRSAMKEFKAETNATVMPGDTIFVRERYF